MKRPFLKRLGESLSFPFQLRGRRDEDENKPKRDWRPATDGVSFGLADMMEENRGAFGDKLHVISIAAFREAVGDETWARLKDKVLMMADNIIRHAIGHNNVYGQQGEDMFVLCFHKGMDEHAQKVRTADIAENLGQRLIGSQLNIGDRPLAHVAEVAIDDVLAGGQLDTDVLEAQVHTVREENDPYYGQGQTLFRTGPAAKAEEPERLAFKPGDTAADPAKRRAFDTTAKTKPEQVRRRAFESGPKEEAQTVPRKAFEGGVPAPQAPQGPRKAFEGGDGLPKDDPNWAKGRSFLTISQEDLDSTPEIPLEDRLAFRFRPVWNGRTERLDTYMLRPLWAYEGDVIPLARGFPKGVTVDMLAAVDAAVIRKAMPLLADMVRKKTRLILPVHLSSLATHRRPLILSALQEADEGLRIVALTLEAMAIPADATPDDLYWDVKGIRDHCAAVIARTHLGAPRFELFRDSPVDMVGAEIEAYDRGQWTVEKLSLALKAFAKQARDEKVKGSYVWGVRKRFEAVDAVRAGLTLVSGSALMKDLPEPGKSIPAPRSRFLPK